MISVTRFTMFRKGAEIIVTGLEEVPCPKCGGRLAVHGTCKRKLKEYSGETKTLRLRVMECQLCRSTHRELMEDIVPYRRYSVDLLCAICEPPDADAAESYITDESNPDTNLAESMETRDAYVCEESIRNRIISWVSWLIAYMKEIGLFQSQGQLDQQYFSLKSCLKEGIREIVNSGRWKVQHQIVMQPF